MSIVFVISDPEKGGTFLTWSLHYLAGHKQYYSVRNQAWTSLPTNPLTKINSHNFLPNQPNNLDKFHQHLDILQKIDVEDFHTVYLHIFDEPTSSDTWDETKQALQKIENSTDKKIVLTNQKKHLIYEKSQRARVLTKSLCQPQKQNLCIQDQFDDFIKYFFNDSFKFWQEQGLTEIWDQREFLALCYKHESKSISSILNLGNKHFDLDCMEWFNTAEKVILDICDYLEIIPDPTCIAHWKQIYMQWRTLHYQRLNFTWCFDKIIEYILNGHYMDLKRFDLDIYQEAIIQHELIYKHNLNLKTWQLEKFTDTLQLHKLLEPNTHIISKKL